MTIGPVSKKRAAAKAGKELQAALGFAYENLGNYLINDDSDDVPQSSVHSQEAHHVPKVSHLRPVDGRRAQRPSNDLALGARKTSSELLAHGSEELGQSSSANAGLPPTRARETGKLDVLLVGYKVDQGSPTRQRSVARLPGRLTRRNTEIDKKTDAIEDPTESALLEGPSKIVASGASELVALGEEDDIVPLTSIEEVEGVIAKYAEIVEKKSRELMSRGLSAQSRAEQDQSNDVWPSREDRNSDRVLVEQEPLRMDDAMDVDRDEEPVLSTASPIGIGREHRLDETTVRESNLEDEAIHHEIDIPQEQLTTTEHLNVDSQVASDDAHAEKSAQINVQSFMPEPFGENTFISSPRLWAQTEEVSPIPSTDDFQSFNLMAHPTADQSSPDQTKHEVPRDYLHADSAPEEDAASQHFFTRPSLVVASLKGIIESRKRRRLEERESAKLRKLETNPLVFAAYADPEYSPVVTEEVIRRSAKKRQVSISDLSRAWPTEVLEAEKQVLVAIATNINEEADNVDQKLPGDHIPSESTVIPGLDLLKLEGHVVPSMKIGKKEKFAPAPWNVSRPFSIAGRIDAIATDFSAPKVIIPAPLIHHGSVHQPLPPRPLSWISQVSPAVRKVSNSEQITMAGDKGRNKHVKKISVDMTDRPRQQEASHVPLNLVVEPSSSSKMRPETNPLRDARPSRPAMGVRALPGQRKPIGNAKGIHSAERRPQEWEQQAEEWRDVLQIQAMMPPTETKHEFLSVEDTWRPQTNEEVIKAADMHGEDTHALARADESGTLPAASVDLGPGRASSPPVETHPPVLTSGSHLSPDIPIAVDEPAEDGNGSSDEDFAESGDVPPIEMANESPLSYYTRKRRMSMGLPPAPNLEIDTSTSSTISGSDSSVKDADALEAIPASPTLSSSSSLFSLPNAVDLKQRATSAARTVAEALQKKGVSAGRYPDFYEVAHGAEARKRLTDEERLKYPVLKGETFHGLDSEEKLKVEIKRLDVLIREGSDSLGDRSRRGMVWAILGEMKKATMDFDAALKSDPFNAETLWCRHQLHLIGGDVDAAIRDLETISEGYRQHIGAWLAKARLYQALDMVKQAIINYTQVIKLKPQLADAYYQRARLFEMENESVYANEDLKMVRVLDPENIHAIRHQSQYSFHRQLWNDAIDGFSRLLLLSPEDAEAFLYRGRAQAHINRWDDALNDLTMTIQLAPGNSEGFWQRASLLRERNPTKAIEDYSIALLLEEGEKASDIYLQRAALYSRLGHHGQAIADLHAVLEIDPSKSKAYLHLGGLHLNVLADYDEALICFDKCLHIDPTQVQAHIGRGELFQHLHHQWMQESSRMHGASVVANASVTRPGTRDMNDKSQTNAAGAGNATSHISKATKEYSRAIHLAPGNYMLYLHRGKLLLKNSRMKAATYDFHTAFELNSSIAQTPYQRALVLSFQRKYAQIGTEFGDYDVRSNQDDEDLTLLVAKARMGVGDNSGALVDLGRLRPSAAVLLTRGIAHQNMGNYADAIAELAEAIYLSPTLTQAYYHRGVCRFKMNDLDGMSDLMKAIEIDPKWFEAWREKAAGDYVKGDYESAVSSATHALSLEPTSILSLLLRGAANIQLAQYQLAIRDFTAAISLNRDSHFAYYNRAVAYEMLGDNWSAIRDHSIALMMFNDSNAYRNRGLIYWRTGDPHNALLDLTAARDAFPEDARLHALLGLCLQKVGRIGECLEAFSAAIRTNPYMAEAYIARGNVYHSTNNYDAALKDYTRVLHLYPDCTEAWVNIGYAFQAQGKVAKAYEILSTAITLDENNRMALEGRAVVNFHCGNWFGALVDVSKALELSPGNPEYLTNKGVIYQALGDIASALHNYKLAIQFDPTYPPAHLNTANLYFHQRRWEEAIERYNEAIYRDPVAPTAYLNRGIAHAMAGNMSAALDDLTHASTLTSVPEIHFNRAQVLMALGRHEEAEQEYTKVLELTPGDGEAFMKRGDAKGYQANFQEAMHDYALALMREGGKLIANKRGVRLFS